MKQPNFVHRQLSRDLKKKYAWCFLCNQGRRLKQALSYIKEGSSVSWGGSMSVSEIGLMDALKEGNYHLIDRSVAKNFDEQREIFLRLSYLIIS